MGHMTSVGLLVSIFEIYNSTTFANKLKFISLSMIWIIHDYKLCLHVYLGKGLLSGKESACQCRGHEFDPWVGKIPWRRKWQPTPVFLTRKFLGQRSLVGYNLWGAKESDTTWWLNNSKFRQILICLGLSCLLWKNEGMSPLQPWKWLTKILSIRLECNAILIGLEMGLVLSYISNIIIWSYKLNSLRFKYVVCDLGAISQNLLSALIPSTVSPSNMEN